MPAAAKPRKKAGAGKAAWVDVETDATGRFTRSNQVLGRGASKVVYKGFDRQQGIEVAWNQVKIVEHLTAKEHGRLQSEVAVLSRLKHRNIMTFYASWIDQQQHTLNFITEYFHPGPLRRHRRNHRHLSRKVLKRWAWQILEGLIYLHGHMPPIIHRDLKCDNIFIHGTTGSVKIGDLGLAKLMEEGLSTCQSVLGTPEFMAPELYREKYNEKVDIYSFGMCLLELVTMEFPYRECKNKAQIFRQVTLGVYPAALQRIEDSETRSFIELCIDHYHERRPAARQLIKHSFFDDVRPERPNSRAATLGSQSDSSCRDSIEDVSPGIYSTGAARPLRPETLPRPPSAPGVLNAKNGASKFNRQPSAPAPLRRGASSSSDPDGPMIRHTSAPLPLERTFSVQQRGAQGSALDFELCMMQNEGGDFRRFKFTFDVEQDTVGAVAEEFMEEFGLTPTETDHFIELLKRELESVPPRERFVPVGSDVQSRAGLQVRLRPGEGKGKGGEEGGVRGHKDGPRRKPTRKFTPKSPLRPPQEGRSPHGFRNPRVLADDHLPRSPYVPVDPDGTEVHSPNRAPGEADGDQVVLMRMGGRERAAPEDHSPSPHVLGESPFAQEGMKDHRPSRDAPEGRDFAVKAYRGDQERRPKPPGRRPGRVVSPEPDDFDDPHGGFRSDPQGSHAPPRAVSPDFQPEPRSYELGLQQGHAGQSPTRDGRSPEPHWAAPSRPYESQNKAPATPTSPAPSSPSPFLRQEYGAAAANSRLPQVGGRAAAPMQRYGSQGLGPQGPAMGQQAAQGQRWTEPGFHMPTCTPFPVAVRKIRTLFGKGS